MKPVLQSVERSADQENDHRNHKKGKSSTQRIQPQSRSECSEEENGYESANRGYVFLVEGKDAQNKNNKYQPRRDEYPNLVLEQTAEKVPKPLPI